MTVTDFIFDHSDPQRAIMLALYESFVGHPGVTAHIRYKIPFFYRKSWLCYLNPLRNGTVELAFTRGDELSNAQGILDFRGRSQVASIILTTPETLPWTGLHEVFREALLLDEAQPYTHPRTRKRKNTL
ncbi:MAG: hypothetical protein OHK0039_22020 [Bacteroidia bacterium]